MSSLSVLPLQELVAQHPTHPTEALYGKMGSIAITDSIPEVDVLLVGAGFGSFTLMNKYGYCLPLYYSLY